MRDQNTVRQTKVWTSPKLRKLGTIADVAGATGPNVQAPAGLKSGSS